MFGGRRRHHGGRNRQGFALALLAMQLYQVGIRHIPPTTLATIALNVGIHLQFLDSFFKSFIRHPSITNICVSTSKVLYRGDWPRLFLAAWFHLDDWHLYYNMASFVWKGIHLERQLGTIYFAYMIAIFSVLTNLVTVGVNIAAAELLGNDQYLVSCAAGFSGVIFALKVISTHYSPRGSQRIMGLFNVPSRWAFWVELIIIQLLVPGASFTGHLAGILVGLAYIKGPLRTIMDFVSNIFTSMIDGYQNGDYGQRQNRPSYIYQADTTGHNDSDTDDDNRPDYERLSEEEQMREAMRRSRETAYPPTSNGQPNSRGYPENRPPPYNPDHASEDNQNYGRLYPDLSGEMNQQSPPYPEEDGMPAPFTPDELRRRRLARFDT